MIIVGISTPATQTHKNLPVSSKNTLIVAEPVSVYSTGNISIPRMPIKRSFNGVVKGKLHRQPLPLLLL
jgi:hypothetical protein